MVVSSHQDTGKAINPTWFQAVVEQIKGSLGKRRQQLLGQEPASSPAPAMSPARSLAPGKAPAASLGAQHSEGCSVPACTGGSGDAAAPQESPVLWPCTSLLQGTARAAGASSLLLRHLMHL